MFVFVFVDRMRGGYAVGDVSESGKGVREGLLGADVGGDLFVGEE